MRKQHEGGTPPRALQPPVRRTLRRLHRLFWVCSARSGPTECQVLRLQRRMTPQSSLYPSSGESVGRFRGSVRATLWPTCSLTGSERWFDELYLWTEGGSASTTERAGIQITRCVMRSIGSLTILSIA